MKKACLIMVMIFGFIGFTHAQGRLQEVVYLKNGSIIRGTIIEQVPNRTLKIETADGSVFVYPMREVQKITKEPYRRGARTPRGNYGVERTSRCRYMNSYTPRGYRGFVELGYAFGVGEDGNNDRLEITTTHGYQFNPYIFVGGGAGIHYYNDAEEALMPVFGEFRANLLDGPITPYVGFKLGYSAVLNDSDYWEGGAFFSPSIGVRFLTGGDKFLNVSFGYSLQQLNYEYYYNGYYGEDSFSMNALHLKIGFEF